MLPTQASSSHPTPISQRPLWWTPSRQATTISTISRRTRPLEEFESRSSNFKFVCARRVYLWCDSGAIVPGKTQTQTVGPSPTRRVQLSQGTVEKRKSCWKYTTRKLEKGRTRQTQHWGWLAQSHTKHKRAPGRTQRSQGHQPHARSHPASPRRRATLMSYYILQVFTPIPSQFT